MTAPNVLIFKTTIGPGQGVVKMGSVLKSVCGSRSNNRLNTLPGSMKSDHH
jgi:hypothetical protein